MPAVGTGNKNSAAASRAAARTRRARRPSASDVNAATNPRTTHVRQARSQPPVVVRRVTKPDKVGGGDFKAPSAKLSPSRGRFAGTTIPKRGRGLVDNAVKDTKELVTGAPASAYLTYKAAIAAVNHDNAPAKAMAHQFKETDPVALAVQGRFKEAGEAAYKRPVSTVLELTAAKGLVGRSAGAVMRHSPSETLRKAASTDRPNLRLYKNSAPGEGPEVSRRYPKDVISKATHVVADKAKDRRGIDPNESRFTEVKDLAGNKRAVKPSVGPMKHPLDDRVDRHVHSANIMRQTVVRKAETKARKQAHKAKKEPQVDKGPTAAEQAKVHTLRNPAVQGLNPEHVAHQAHDVLGIKKPVVMRLMPAARQKALADEMGRPPRGYTQDHGTHYKVEINPQHPGNKGPKGVSNVAHYELGRAQGMEQGKHGPGAVGSHNRGAYFDNANTAHAQEVLRQHVGTDLRKPRVHPPELPKQKHAAVKDDDPVSAAGHRAAQAAQQTSMKRAIKDFGIEPSSKPLATRAAVMKLLPGHEARLRETLIPVNAARLERIPGEGEPIAINPDARRLQVANMQERAWRDATDKNMPGRWILMPKRVVDRFVEHAENQGKHGPIQKTANQFKDTVLTAVNPAHWLASNAADLGMRGALEGLTPGDLYRGARVYKELGKHGRQGEMVRASTMGGGFGHLARDVGRDIEAPGVGHLAKAWHAYRAGVYGIESAIESLPQIGTVGKELRTGVTPGLKGGLKGLLRATDEQVQHFATKMVTDPAKEIQIARHVEDVIGKWGKLSPAARHALSIAPFAQWLGAATKYVLITLPAKHPIKTGVMAGLNQMTLPERQALGLSQYLPLKDQAQDYQMQVLPKDVGKNKFGPVVKGPNLTTMLSFGTTADALDLNIGGFLGPQVQNAMQAAQGTSYTGEHLKYQSGPNAGMPLSADDKRRTAIGMLIESFTPGATMFRRVVQEKGQPAMPQSTIIHPEIRLKYNAKTKKMEKPSGPSSKGAKKLVNPFPTQTVYTKGAVASMEDTATAIRKDKEWNAQRKQAASPNTIWGSGPPAPSKSKSPAIWKTK